MRKLFPLIFYLTFLSVLASAQSSTVIQFFPKKTQAYFDISYAYDTLTRHLLDIYLPVDHQKAHPIILWIHSGGWRAGNKQADMHYFPRTIQALINNGYAIVAINYRYSTNAIFPAQIQDCNQGLNFIYKNAEKYRLDKTHIALMGFSAGGHLAALMGLAANNNVPDFYTEGKMPDFRISAVIDFYGLSTFSLIASSEYVKSTKGPGLLFGAAMNDKPSLVKQATPLFYIDRNDPPFLIVHGTKDELMDVRQSITLHDSLKSNAVAARLMLIEGSPHGGKMFDSRNISNAVISFLNRHLKND